MLIAVHEQPPLQVPLSSEADWKTVEKQSWSMLNETRDSLAPDARTVVQSDTLVWRALRRVVRREHRDLLVVGSARDADDGGIRIGRSARELLTHLECPLAFAPSGMRNLATPRLERIGVGFDGRPGTRPALALAGSIAHAAGAELVVRGVVDDRVRGGLTVEQTILEGDAVVTEQLVRLLDRERGAARASATDISVDVATGSPENALSELGEQSICW